MARIVLLCYHGIGHFNPCFRLARILQQRHEVVFAGSAFFQPYVKTQGFSYYPLQTLPFAAGFEEWVNKTGGKNFPYLHAIKDRWTDRLYNLRAAELGKLVQELSPDLILLDASQPTDFLVLYPLLRDRNIRVAIFHTTLPSVLRAGLPPLNSDALPDDGTMSAQSGFLKEKWRKNLWQRVKYFGKTTDAIAKRRIALNHVPGKYISADTGLYNPCLAGIDEYIFSIRELDFPVVTVPRHHYLGFMIEASRTENADPDFESSLRQITQRISEGKKLLLCSFGTVTYDNRKRLQSFLAKLTRAVAGSAYVLVVADPSYNRSIEPSPGSDIFFFRRVPMLKLLPDATVMITHGGFNSVKESIAAGVPMLVYPIEPRTDQKGIAARVAWHQLGLRGDLDTDSPDDIAGKIGKLQAESIFKRKIDAMNLAARGYDEANILHLLENIQPLD